MNSDKYLVFMYFGVRPNDSKATIISKATKKAYLNFGRSISFLNQVSAENIRVWEISVEQLLSEQIPMLLATSDTQESFDIKHNELCSAMMEIYENKWLSFGRAQRWLNLALLNLVLVDNAYPGFLNISETRRYFHVPVDRFLCDAATKNKSKHKHCLNAKTPFGFGAKPFEEWNYSEYMDFQLSVRKKVKELGYSDPLEWVFCAYPEAAQERIYN